MQKAIFLDRDGVINQAVIKNGKPYPPASLAELQIAADVYPALLELKKAGFLLIVVTNQPDVKRGKTSIEIVENIHSHLMQTLPLNEIYTCMHDDDDNCVCRKPNPGLLLQAASKYQIDLKQSFMIGDRWKDIAAGQAAQCKTIWLNYHYQEKAPLTANFVTTSLQAAADWILNTQ